MKMLPHRYARPAVILAAVAVVCWAVSRYEARIDWIIFLLIAVLTIPFTTGLLLSALFAAAPLLMAVAMIYGTPACVLAVAAYGLLAAVSVRRSFPGTIWDLCASVALLVCEAFLYSAAYHLLKPVNLFVAVVAMAFVSYLMTSLLRRENESWTNRSPLLLNPFLAATCAAFLSVFRHPFAAVLSVPAIAVIRYWTKIHESRLGGCGSETPPAGRQSVP
jgi:hypothetical protein